MGWLVDNNVPRSVTLFLADRGEDVVEVRAVLGQEAPDAAVVAYAAARQLRLITHDRGCSRSARNAGVRHVWLRTPESQDVQRLREVFGEIVAALDLGIRRVTLFLTVIRLDD